MKSPYYLCLSLLLICVQCFSLRNLRLTGNMSVESLVHRESVSRSYETNLVSEWMFPTRPRRRRRKVPRRRSLFTKSPKSRSVTAYRLRDRADAMFRSQDVRRTPRKPRIAFWLRSRNWLVPHICHIQHTCDIQYRQTRHRKPSKFPPNSMLP